MEVVIPVRKSNAISGFIISSKPSEGDGSTMFVPYDGLNEKDPELTKLVNNFNGTNPSPRIVAPTTGSGTQDHIFNTVFGPVQYPSSFQADLLAGSRACDRMSEQTYPAIHAFMVPGNSATRSYELFENEIIYAVGMYNTYNDEYALGVALHQVIDAFQNAHRANCIFNVYKHKVDITYNPSLKVWSGLESKDVYKTTARMYQDLKKCHSAFDVRYYLRPWSISYLTPKVTIIWSAKSNINL